jgi:hypothetical protein
MPEVSHYTWPGFYPLVCLVESDFGTLNACPSCVNQNKVGKNAEVQQHINWEDHDLYCDVCEKHLECAY